MNDTSKRFTVTQYNNPSTARVQHFICKRQLSFQKKDSETESAEHMSVIITDRQYIIEIVSVSLYYGQVSISIPCHNIKSHPLDALIPFLARPFWLECRENAFLPSPNGSNPEAVRKTGSQQSEPW